MSASKRPRPQRLYRYVIDHDRGFAPNPFFGVCTLACCKPGIRKHAAIGDIIVGFGTAKYDLDGHIIYWMAVDEISDFDSYWGDPRFLMKRPQMGGSLSLCFGDNIYRRSDDNGRWIQEASFHSDPNSRHGGGNLKRDTGTTDKLLIGKEFAYWGGDGPKTPAAFDPLVWRRRGEKYRVEDPSMQAEFISWLRSIPERGLRRPPADWTRDRKLRALLQTEKKAC
ncbi:hypothetical protein HY29_14085 [Hyphomonas beringensis]|uniref:Nucleotide modification associated domain-containing protein n=1 Tax=Hyphomonas beringensis TaxID=1280946 RepID=A0A062UF12_9PROT|nr:hypothetical protein [Hyphomonas beringensis]KCZ54675.1 hypothetical protein HY29_14085 [Hyphomonas beringensis]